MTSIVKRFVAANAQVQAEAGKPDPFAGLAFLVAEMREAADAIQITSVNLGVCLGVRQLEGLRTQSTRLSKLTHQLAQMNATLARVAEHHLKQRNAEASR